MTPTAPTIAPNAKKPTPKTNSRYESQPRTHTHLRRLNQRPASALPLKVSPIGRYAAGNSSRDVMHFARGRITPELTLLPISTSRK